MAPSLPPLSWPSLSCLGWALELPLGRTHGRQSPALPRILLVASVQSSQRAGVPDSASLSPSSHPGTWQAAVGGGGQSPGRSPRGRGSRSTIAVSGLCRGHRAIDCSLFPSIARAGEKHEHCVARNLSRRLRTTLLTEGQLGPPAPAVGPRARR